MFKELIYNRLTDEQKSFVDDFNNSILVSASAGTGKTTTMIRKILHLLLIEKIDVNNLLVVTYTTAAASKMKHDLYMGLQSALKYAENDEEMINHISSQMDLLNNADIGTIHSFCNKIIKKYFYDLGLDPNYSILSNEKAKSYLINNSLNNIFENEKIVNNEKFFRLYENFNNNRNDLRLRSAIISLYEYLICRIDSDKWLKEKLDVCYRENDNIVWNYLLEYYKDKGSTIKDKLLLCYDLANTLNYDKAKAFAVCRIDYINKIIEAKTCQELSHIVEIEKIPNKIKIDASKDVALYDLADLVDFVAEEFKKYKKECEEIFKCFSDSEFSKNNIINKENAEELYNLCIELKKEYDKVKEENNLLDFNDLEFYATKLCDNVKIIDELKSEYKYIFVDEYQDVNPMQDSIITKIANTNNLYMIGDVKQSIYRFRQSSPEIFLEKYNSYKAGLNDKKVILFNKNFRSDANILYFVNNIFDNAITKEVVGIDYKNEARLQPGLEVKGLNKSVDITIIDANDFKDYKSEIEEELGEEVTKREYEAKLIATKVAEIIDSTDYKFRDIAILLRDKKELTRQVWIALKKYNIPVSVMIKGNIFKSTEVLVLYSLLKCMYNEANDIAFVTLLKSPFINATDEDLVDIKLSAKEVNSFYEACLVAESINSSAGQKVAKLRSVLRNLRLQILNENIADVIRQFVTNENLLVYYKSMPDGIEKECYIKEFINIVASQLYENDLARLLDYLEIIEDKESEIRISSGGDSVTLMTMHSSKGLDYPVVIIGGFGEDIVKNSISDVKINKDFGLAVNSINEDEYYKIANINSKAITLKNRKEEFEEAIRLCYVALTRPKNRLYITGVVPLDKLDINSIKDVKTYFDLILFSMDNIDKSFFKSSKSNFELNINKNCIVKCHIVDVKDLLDKMEESQIILDVSNPEIVAKLTKYYNMQLPDYSGIAFKNSVSSILRDMEVDYVNALENFKKLTIKESVSSIEAMELGTQYHEIMRYLDYKDCNQNIKKLVDSLVFSGVINPIYLNKIDIAKIEKAKEVIATLLDDKSIVKQEINFLTLAPHSKLINNSECGEKVLVQGIIDLCIEKDGSAIIVDYKTNRTNNKEYLVETYKTQLDLYAKSYEMAYGKKVIKKYLYSFQMDSLIEVE